jgi:hypothetical protein
MCTYETKSIGLRASGKTPDGWRAMDSATVYYDHPIHLPAGHALMIDIRNQNDSASLRVALELDAHSARELAEAILRTLDSVPSDLLEGSTV